MPLVITATLSLLLTGIFIKIALTRGWGKGIHADVPEHQGKAGTPTMGGVAFLLAAVIGWMIFGEGREGAAVLLLMAATSLLGLADDVLALRRHKSGGTTTGVLARWRILFQAAIALAFALDAVNSGHVLTALPALDVAIYTFVIVGAINALNLSDGLDGLAGGMAAIMFLAFSGTALGPILIGAVLGFLWYNARPARVFMGGVGSESLGAGLAGLAIVTGTVWYLPLLALVPMAVVLSVIAQVTYFRATGGKRLLLRAPLHHHFEMAGMEETIITVRFWLVTAAATALTVWLLGGSA